MSDFKIKDNVLSGVKITCGVCGDEEELYWDRKTNEQLFRLNLCFTCNHWQEHFDKDKARTNAVVVKGVHYLICPDEPKDQRRWSGFGGAKFVVRFKDGRTVETHNLWCQGRISEKWLDKFPDNAEFAPYSP